MIKRYIGAAGAVFTKEAMRTLMSTIPYREAIMWDWAFCRHWAERGKHIYVASHSYVLHTGIDGENTNVMLFEFADGFIPSTEFEKAQLEKLDRMFVERYMQLTDSKKISILMRKTIRERLRRTIATLLGEKCLFTLLAWRKRVRYKRKEKNAKPG